MSYQLASKSWDEKEYQAIMGVLSDDYYKMGSICKNFEEAYAEWNGAKYAVFCNSGSSANLLAVAAMHHDPRQAQDERKEILVPAVSWSTTYYPITQMRYEPVFVDVSEASFNICIEDLKSKITSNTKAIFAVNLLGNPCNYKVIKSLCEEHNLYLLEDNCESMGAVYKEKKTGTLGNIGTHSTFFSHHMSTMEGGICVTDDELTYEIMKSLRAHGWVRDVDNKELFYSYFQKPKSDFDEFFHFVLPGYNFRPTEVQGAIGIQQIKKLDSFITARLENAMYLKSLLSQHHQRIHLQTEEDGAVSSWFGFGLLFENQTAKNEAAQTLINNGVECRPIVSGNMLRQPVFSGYMKAEKLPGAEKIHDCGIMVGNHQFPIKEQISFLMDLL